MSNVGQSSCRVAMFISDEEYHRAANGEWYRDDSESSDPLDTQINQFLAEHDYSVLQISAPTIQLIAHSPDTRSYRCGCSLIYKPTNVVVVNEQQSPSIPQPVGDPIVFTPTDVGVGALAESGEGAPIGVGIPPTARHDILQQLSQQLGFEIVEAPLSNR